MTVDGVLRKNGSTSRSWEADLMQAAEVTGVDLNAAQWDEVVAVCKERGLIPSVDFAYQGFGTLLYQAALNTDIYLIEACAMISVVAVVLTQMASEVLYAWLNPRMSFR